MRQLISCALIALSLAACGGGGGGGTNIPPTSWNQFHHDGSRRGSGGGFVLPNLAALRSVAIDALDPNATELSPITASPVVDLDNIVYAASEAGTVAAIDPNDFTVKWSTNTCDIIDGPQFCPRRIGSVVSTPVIFQSDMTTTVVVADRSGNVYFFDLDATRKDPQPECMACFNAKVDGRLEEEFGEGAEADFISSATVTINPLTATIQKVLIGAVVTIPGRERAQGKLYAINNDGTLRWEYPARGAPPIGPMSASPTLGVGDAVHFITDDGILHTLTGEGFLKREAPAAPAFVSPDLLMPSAVTSSAIYISDPGGAVRAIDHSGGLRWERHFDGERFLGTLIASAQSAPPETPTPIISPTHTPEGLPTSTPTPTETPAFTTSNLFLVSEGGNILVLNEPNGVPVYPSGRSPDVPVEGSVFTSPILSSDRQIVFTAGHRRGEGGSPTQVYIYDSYTLDRPRVCMDRNEGGSNNDKNSCLSDSDCKSDQFCARSFWPFTLPGTCSNNPRVNCRDDEECAPGFCKAPAPVYSSPAITDDGTIAVGSDDGFLYLIGRTGTPARMTPTPSRPAEDTPTATRTATEHASLTPTPVVTQDPPPSSTPEPTATDTPAASPSETLAATATEAEATATPTLEETPTVTGTEEPVPTNPIEPTSTPANEAIKS